MPKGHRDGNALLATEFRAARWQPTDYRGCRAKRGARSREAPAMRSGKCRRRCSARAAFRTMTARGAVAMRTAAQASAGNTISHSPFGALARRRRIDGRSTKPCSSPLLQPHATPTVVADRPFADQFDPRTCQRVDKLHQRIDVPSDDAVARFHALDRGQRETRTFGQLALINPQK